MRWQIALGTAALVVSPAQAQDATTDAAQTAAPLPRGSDVPSPGPEDQLPPPPPTPEDHQALEPQAVAPEDPYDRFMPGRRRPGVPGRALPDDVVQDNPGAIRPIETFPGEADGFPGMPDRWRLITALCPERNVYRALTAVCRSKRDPYHQNLLKGDIPLDPHKVGPLPIRQEDWFLTLSAVSDTLAEPRSFPTPVGVQTSDRPGSLDSFGRSSSLLLAQSVTLGAALTKGSTAYKPPEIEYRIALTYAYTYADASERRVLSVRPTDPTHRQDAFLGVQEAFVDYHLRNTSDRYDFDSIRAGIQPFQADFRGFLFNDSQLGIRLFGNRDDNRFQYNIALFWRLEKDTNTGLNDITQAIRSDYVAIANVYRQDLPVPGFTSQLLLAYNRNREGDRVTIDHNDFPIRPALLGNLRGRDYDLVYAGYNGDGHFGRINLTLSAYGVFGEDRNSIFTGRQARVRGWFAAAEPSYDLDWARFRLSGLYQSGDKDPFDDTETGFDAIQENPLFAGADTSYWVRQSVPFVGGGRAIGLNGRNGVLATLRSSKDQGQANFTNPGLLLFGIGGDFDLTPTLRLSANANHLSFATTRVLQVLRNEGSIPREIGFDTSLSATWRPRMTQNIVLRASFAMLSAGDGFRDLFTQSNGSGRYYSGLANLVVAY